MNSYHSKHFRLLAIALTSRGLGYAVLEEEKSLIENGHTSSRNEIKNNQCLSKTEDLFRLYRPDVLILDDVLDTATRRAQRIKSLHREVLAVAKRHKLPVKLISRRQVRRLLFGNERGTKQEVAELLAKRFPVELSFQLPHKRRTWESADSRMDIFDAVSLAVAYRIKKTAHPVDK
jgi:hypothetical protein